MIGDPVAVHLAKSSVTFIPGSTTSGSLSQSSPYITVAMKEVSLLPVNENFPHLTSVESR